MKTFMNVKLTKRYQLGSVYRWMHLPDMAKPQKVWKHNRLYEFTNDGICN